MNINQFYLIYKLLYINSMKFEINKSNKKKLKMLINVVMMNREKNLQIQNLNVDRFINDKKIEIQRVKNESQLLEDKILVIIACHTVGKLRWNSINSIMTFLHNVNNIDIVIVNSTNLPLSDSLKNIYSKKYMKYIEIPNDNYYGFSKWYQGLEQIDLDEYKFVTFINDSILIHNDIRHFFDYTRYKNVDLLGYNDSNETCYHYQSYLFSIKREYIDKFKTMFNDYKNLIHNYNDVVKYYELKMMEYFLSKDCFLKLTNMACLNDKNIFFNNDNVYLKLRKNGLLPFTKLKRLTDLR